VAAGSTLAVNADLIQSTNDRLAVVARPVLRTLASEVILALIGSIRDVVGAPRGMCVSDAQSDAASVPTCRFLADQRVRATAFRRHAWWTPESFGA
jgi:hypothetical protein